MPGWSSTSNGWRSGVPNEAALRQIAAPLADLRIELAENWIASSNCWPGRPLSRRCRSRRIAIRRRWALPAEIAAEIAAGLDERRRADGVASRMAVRRAVGRRDRARHSSTACCCSIAPIKKWR